MITHVILICTCTGSQAVSVEDMKHNPSGVITCGYVKTIDGERVACKLQYPVTEIFKAYENGRSTYYAIDNKQLPLELKG